MSVKVCVTYQKYVWMSVENLDKFWAIHNCNEHCKQTLEGWLWNEKMFLKFFNLWVWLEPTDHFKLLFFNMVNARKIQKRKKLCCCTLLRFLFINYSNSSLLQISGTCVTCSGWSPNKYSGEEETDAEDLDYLPEVPKNSSLSNPLKQKSKWLGREYEPDQVRCKYSL